MSDKSTQLYKLIYEFNEKQEASVEILNRLWNVEFPITNRDWVKHRLEKWKGQSIHEKDNIRIFSHGYGVRMSTPDFKIDFDFGENGEYNGFDPGRLFEFNEANNLNFDFADWSEIEQLIKNEVEQNNIVYSGNINYYVVKNEPQHNS